MREVLYRVIGVLGLVFIIFANILITREKEFKRVQIYPFLIIGGICLFVYSIFLDDIVFMILEGIFILISIYGLIKLHEKHRK